jgi:hypothetical protein
MGKRGLQCDRGITLLLAGFSFFPYDLAMFQLFLNQLLLPGEENEKGSSQPPGHLRVIAVQNTLFS